MYIRFVMLHNNDICMYLSWVRDTITTLVCVSIEFVIDWPSTTTTHVCNMYLFCVRDTIMTPLLLLLCISCRFVAGCMYLCWVRVQITTFVCISCRFVIGWLSTTTTVNLKHISQRSLVGSWQIVRISIEFVTGRFSTISTMNLKRNTHLRGCSWVRDKLYVSLVGSWQDDPPQQRHPRQWTPSRALW